MAANFYINVPIALVALAGAFKLLPLIKPAAKPQVDWIGMLIYSVTVGFLVFFLIEGSKQTGIVVHVIRYAFCFGLFCLFIWLQFSLEKKGFSQSVPAVLLRNRHFTLGSLFVVLLFTAISGALFVMSIVLQEALHFSVRTSGFILMVHPAFVMLASLVSSKLGVRFLLLRLTLGSLFLLFGMLLLFFAVSNVKHSVIMALPFVFIGTGMGLSAVAVFQYVLSFVNAEDAGAGSGVLQSVQQVGILLGISILGALFFTGQHESLMVAAKTVLLASSAIYLVTCLGWLSLLWQARCNNLS